MQHSFCDPSSKNIGGNQGLFFLHWATSNGSPNGQMTRRTRGVNVWRVSYEDLMSFDDRRLVPSPSPPCFIIQLAIVLIRIEHSVPSRHMSIAATTIRLDFCVFTYFYNRDLTCTDRWTQCILQMDDHWQHNNTVGGTSLTVGYCLIS